MFGEEDAELFRETRNTVVGLEIGLIGPWFLAKEIDFKLPRFLPSDPLEQLFRAWKLDTVPSIRDGHHGITQEFEPCILLSSFDTIRLGGHA